MKKIINIILLSSLIACSSVKYEPLNKGGINEARKNVIYDILINHSKRGDFFNIRDDMYSKEGFYIFSVYINENISYPGNDMGHKSTFFPSRYIELKGRLFFWPDTTRVVSQEVLKKLEKYNAVTYYPFVGGRLNAITFIVCKSDISHYIKVDNWRPRPEDYSLIKCPKK